jgi:uncharacterized membrane protein YecN with MAPEG domain
MTNQLARDNGRNWSTFSLIQRAMHSHSTVSEYLPTILAKLAPFT